jgi:hypothetical protein
VGPAHGRERGWEHSARTRVDSGCMLHRGGSSLVVQGRLVLRPLGAGPSGALHACMHFDQRVLGYLGTDRPLRARPTIDASPYDRGRQR